MINRLELLGESQLDMVHEASLRVLEQTGVVFNFPKALEIFQEHGAKVDGKIVRIPRNMVESALKTSPARYTYRARNPKHTMEHGIGQKRLLVSPCYGSPFISENGVERPGTSEDYIKLTRLVQACDPVTVTGGVLTDASDIPADRKELYTLYYAMKYSDKLLLSFTGTTEKINHMFRMAQIAFEQGDELWNDYVMAVPICPTSPLKYEQIAAESLIAYAEKGQPIYIVNCLMGGVTAPLTVLGTAVQQNVEFLAGLVLAQLIHPGVPVTYVPGSTVGNMRTVSYANGSPEGNLCNVIGLQLAYRYQVPNRVMAGITDSKVEDYQAGLETMQNALFLALAGAQFFHNGVGTLDSLMAMSLPKFILDSECLDRVQRILSGVDFCEEDLCVDEIMELGHYGNHLMHDNTLLNFAECWRPSVSFMDPHLQWEQEGALDAKARAEKEAARLLAESPEEGVLAPEIDAKLKDYLAAL